MEWLISAVWFALEFSPATMLKDSVKLKLKKVKFIFIFINYCFKICKQSNYIGLSWSRKMGSKEICNPQLEK